MTITAIVLTSIIFLLACVPAIYQWWRTRDTWREQADKVQMATEIEHYMRRHSVGSYSGWED